MRSTTGTQAVSQAVQENLPLAFFKAKMGNSGLESKRCPNSQLPPPAHGLQRVWSCHGCAWLCTSGGGRAGVLPHVCGAGCSQGAGWWDGAVVSPQWDCLQAEQSPALALLYLTSLLSECIKTYIRLHDISGLIRGSFWLYGLTAEAL